MDQASDTPGPPPPPRGEEAQQQSPASSTGEVAPLRVLVSGLLKGRSLREAVMLGIRLVAARGMSLLTLVVAAWLVDIQTFAEFGVYQTLATLASIALFLRYDAAVVAAPDRNEARTAFHLCLGVGAVLWVAFALGSVASGSLGWMRSDLAILLPFSILARAFLRLSYAHTTGERDFKGLGRGILAQALIQPAVLLGLVLLGVEDVLCFVLADIVGHCSGVLYLMVRQRSKLARLFTGFSTSAVAEVARRWNNLPLYNLPASFFSIAFVMSPLLITPMAADAFFAGHVALAYRIFDVPTQIMAAAATPLFLNFRPTHERRTPIFGRSMLIGLMVLTGSIYAILASVLLLADPILDQTALAGLAEAVPFVAAFQLFIALAAPLNEACALYPEQRRLVLIQGSALCGSFIAAFVALSVSVEAGLITLAVVAIGRMLAVGELLRTLSGSSHRAFAPLGRSGKRAT